MIVSKISGADLGPKDMSRMLERDPFQIGTSTTLEWPSSVATIIFLVAEVIDSMEHMKISATMKMARKL